MQIRIWRSLPKEEKTVHRLAKALLVTEEGYKENLDSIESLTKTVRFKMSSLNEGKILQNL